MAAPVASVIVSTYNQAALLEHCLWGYAQQDRLDFELVVADDGSSEETTERLDRLRPEMPFVLKHVWQSDRGSRKCRILNRAILVAAADYLLFSDGACVPRRDFVSQHLRLREPGRFLGGGYCRLSPELSQRIDRPAIETGRFAEMEWLLAQDAPPGGDALVLLSRPGWREQLREAVMPAPVSWAGNNASAWKEDIVRVNGFDERLDHGDEDLEMGDRLANAGVRGKQIRYSAICVHLEPENDYVDEVSRAAHRRIHERTRAEHRSWTDHGIVSLRLD